MGQDAQVAAIFKYRGIEVEQHEDDDGTLICQCFGVSENRIRRVIIENNLTTVEQVTHYVKAGGGFSSCAAGIEDVLNQVRPMLVADGGDVELFDVDGDLVKVILKGACGTCSSSTATLKDAIEVRLREQILSTLTVEAV
jgi:NifU-like protein